jgi:hypothetical protein
MPVATTQPSLAQPPPQPLLSRPAISEGHLQLKTPNQMASNAQPHHQSDAAGAAELLPVKKADAKIPIANAAADKSLEVAAAEVCSIVHRATEKPSAF